MFSCEYCKIFKNTYSEEHLRTTASGLSFNKGSFLDYFRTGRVSLEIFFSYLGLREFGAKKLNNSQRIVLFTTNISKLDALGSNRLDSVSIIKPTMK